jgi:hypothetical protein
LFFPLALKKEDEQKPHQKNMIPSSAQDISATIPEFQNKKELKESLPLIEMVEGVYDVSLDIILKRICRECSCSVDCNMLRKKGWIIKLKRGYLDTGMKEKNVELYEGNKIVG